MLVLGSGASTNGTQPAQAPHNENGFWDLSPHLLAILGFDGRVRRLNPALGQLLGYDEDALNERGLLGIVDEHDRPEALAAVRELAAARREQVDLELRVRCRRGMEHTLLGSARACPERQLIYVAAGDVTERRRVEREASLARGAGHRHRCGRDAGRGAHGRFCGASARRPVSRSGRHGPAMRLLVPRARSGVALGPERARGVHVAAARAMTFERGTACPGRAWETRRAVWVDDMKADATCPGALRAGGRHRRRPGGAGAVRRRGRRGARVLRQRARARDERRSRNWDARVAAQLGPMIERKRAEQALRGSEERLPPAGRERRGLRDRDARPRGNVGAGTTGAERITGYASRDIIGYHVSRFYTPEAVDRGGARQPSAAPRADGPSSTPAGGCAPTASATAPR